MNEEDYAEETDSRELIKKKTEENNVRHDIELMEVM